LLFLPFVVLHWYLLAGPDWLAIKQKRAVVHAEREQPYLESMGYKHVEGGETAASTMPQAGS
jgi:hypothetical protein